MADSDIQGKVTDGSGNPVGDAVVALWSQNAPNNIKTTRTDSNGIYSFREHPDGDGTSQNWHVAARDPNDGTRQFPSLHSISAQISANAIPNTVISEWPIDEGTGSIVADVVSDHDGSITSASWVSDSLTDTALDFVEGDYVEIPNTSDLNLTGNLSITSWVYWEGNNGGWQPIYSNNGSGADTGYGLLYPNDDSSISLRVSGSNFATPYWLPNQQEWFFIGAALDDGAGSCEFLVLDANLNELHSDTISVSNSPTTNSDPEYLGSQSWSISNGGWNGRLRRTNVHNSALTKSELKNEAERAPWT